MKLNILSCTQSYPQQYPGALLSEKPLVITAKTVLDQPQAESLSRHLALPLVPWQEALTHPWVLICQDQYLMLRFPGAAQPFYVDFSEKFYLKRLQQATCAHEPLARALGLKTNNTLHVVDGTHGWGHDAVLLAKLGAQVTAIERSPIVSVLTANGLHRAASLEWFSDLNIQLHLADTAEFLAQMPQKPDAIYLDPMFPKRPNQAVVKKPLRLLQMLLENPAETDINLLIVAALQYARQRVVIKRPAWAPPLYKKPNFSVPAGIVRFDGYLI